MRGVSREDAGGDRWLTTGRRAASAKPWEPRALDEGHYVRKTKAAVQVAKSRIDTGQPATMDRWKGKNFDTVSRRAAEASAAERALAARRNVLKRVEGYSAPHEQRKDDNNVSAHPALIQRRSREPSWGDVRQWHPPKATVGLTRKEGMDTKIWSMKPPWVASITNYGRPPSGGWCPPRVTVTADQALERPQRTMDCIGGARDLLYDLGIGHKTPLGVLLGLKLIARDDLDLDGHTHPASNMARKRGRSLSAGRVRRRCRSLSGGRSGSRGRHARGGSAGATPRAGSAGSGGMESASGRGRSRSDGAGRVRASRSADSGRKCSCGWCGGNGGEGCEACGGVVLGDEVDRELNVVKEKVLDSLLRHGMYSEEEVKMVIEDAILSHPQLVQHRLISALQELAGELGVDCSDIGERYRGESASISNGLEAARHERSKKDLGLVEVRDNSSDEEEVLRDQYHGSWEESDWEESTTEGEEGVGSTMWSSFRSRALGQGSSEASSRHDPAGASESEDDVDQYLRSRDDEAVAKRAAALSSRKGGYSKVKFSGSVASRPTPTALREASGTSAHKEGMMQQRLEHTPQEIVGHARGSWGAQWDTLSLDRRVAECKLAAELMAYTEDFKRHVSGRANLAHALLLLETGGDADEDWAAMTLPEKVALCRQKLNAMSRQVQVQAYTAHVREAAAILHMRAESDRAAFELNGGGEEVEAAIDEWSNMSVEQRLEACAMVLRSDAVLYKAVTNQEPVQDVHQRIRADGDVMPPWIEATGGFATEMFSTGTMFCDDTGSSGRVQGGRNEADREEEKRRKRAERIDALERKAGKAHTWFEAQRVKLNEMIREHNSKRPKDVGQARTARKGRTGGTLNMIKAMECATFRPNPFTYEDRGLRWAFETNVTRIKEQRKLVKHARLRWDEIREDLRYAKEEEDLPVVERKVRPVALKGTDKYGQSLLEDRIKRDETMSLPTRELKKELNARNEAEIRDAQLRHESGPLRQAKRAKERLIQERCCRLYLDSYISRYTNQGVHFRNGDAGYRLWNKSKGHPAADIHGGKNGYSHEDLQKVTQYVQWLRLSRERDKKDVEHRGGVLKQW